MKNNEDNAYRKFPSDIEWIFFDMGSTLIDESECVETRYKETTNNTNVSYQEFKNRVIELAATTDDPYKKAIEEYGIEKSKWYKNLEKLYPYTEKVLKEASKKYKLGIIANQVAGSEQRLENWKIKKYFDVIVASTEEGVEKPDLKIFEIALTRAKCQPEKALMVGDRIDNDIIPAKKLGMKTLWVKQNYGAFKPDSTVPTYTINTLEEILNFIK